MHRKEAFQHLALKSEGFWGKEVWESVFYLHLNAEQGGLTVFCAQARSLLPILFPVPFAWFHHRRSKGTIKTLVLQDRSWDRGSILKAGGVLQNTSHLTCHPSETERKRVIILEMSKQALWCKWPSSPNSLDTLWQKFLSSDSKFNSSFTTLQLQTRLENKYKFQ